MNGGLGRIIYCISGFTQKRNDPHGIDAIWWRLMDQVSKEFYPAPFRWNDNMKQAAQLALRRGPRAEIGIVAYSWGAGYAAMRLCWELRRWGRTVDQVVLIDPVYRSKLITFRWLAFTRRIIKVPDNVKRIGYWYQKNAGPVGSDLGIEPGTELLFKSDVSGRGLDHYTIQHDSNIHDTAVQLMVDDWAGE